MYQYKTVKKSFSVILVTLFIFNIIIYPIDSFAQTYSSNTSTKSSILGGKLSITSPKQGDIISGNMIIVTGNCKEGGDVIIHASQIKPAKVSCVNSQYSIALTFSDKVKSGRKTVVARQKGQKNASVRVVYNKSLQSSLISNSVNGPRRAQARSCEESPTKEITGTIRDFNVNGSNWTMGDFERVDYGPTYFIKNLISGQQKPVFDYCDPMGGDCSEDSFNQWFNDVDGVNKSKQHTITLEDYNADGIYNYSNNNFFPIDNELWGNNGRIHNYHFTYEIHNTFRAIEGREFTFTGDDDFWLFLNGKLAIDIPGVHPPQSKTITLTKSNMLQFGLQEGKLYPIDIFFAERHTALSNFSIDTTFEIGCEDVEDPEDNPIASLIAIDGKDFLINWTMKTLPDPHRLVYSCLNSTKSEGINFNTQGLYGEYILYRTALPKIDVSPNVDTTYTLICTNEKSGKIATAKVDIGVLPINLLQSYIISSANWNKDNPRYPGYQLNGVKNAKIDFEKARLFNQPQFDYFSPKDQEFQVVNIKGGNPVMLFTNVKFTNDPNIYSFTLPIKVSGLNSKFEFKDFQWKTCNPLGKLVSHDRYFAPNGATIDTDGRAITSYNVWKGPLPPLNIPKDDPLIIQFGGKCPE